jgi:putative transposase
VDGKGGWIDNVFIERLWRSVRYEDFYTRRRGHWALDYRTPDDVYFGARTDEFAAAV